MKVGTYANTSANKIDVSDIKIFKPIQKVIIKAKVNGDAGLALFKAWFDALSEDERINWFGSAYSDELGAPVPSPSALVRLIDSVKASNDEIVAETKLSTLSEIAARFEGFFKLAQIMVDADYKLLNVNGYCLYSIMLNESGAVTLSNDKYLQLDLFGLIPGWSYEVYGFEYVVQNDFCRTYSKFYLAPTELEKQYSVGDYEFIALPLSKLKEIQFFSKDGVSSPIYTPEELKFDAEMTNDIVSLGGLAGGRVDANIYAKQEPQQYPY